MDKKAHILTVKFQHGKKCTDGKNRNFILYFLNGVQVLKHKRPFDENMRKGFDGKWHYKNIYILNNTLFQTRYNADKSRCVKYPISKKILEKFDISQNYKIELSETLKEN